MSLHEIIFVAGGVVVVLAVVALFVLRRRPRALKQANFQSKWVALQKLCGNKQTWSQAITNADKLLDEALRKRRVGGKNMGERLVQAQRIFTDNDAVWFGHKLRNRIESDPEAKLKEADVKDALIGIRQALKDLGALPK
ncbi:MAG TPA: hypothetical protein VLG16_05475 [Candidatus Saccharimonadales bacterium]|nr:hypothetical protein [Candidatus Saccharimonadales bacterium]